MSAGRERDKGRIHESGAQKRKRKKDKDKSESELLSKTPTIDTLFQKKRSNVILHESDGGGVVGGIESVDHGEYTGENQL